MTVRKQVEHDTIQHWLWGSFEMLSGDDKSTWYWLAKNGKRMLYVPDAMVTTYEVVTGSALHRALAETRAGAAAVSAATATADAVPRYAPAATQQPFGWGRPAAADIAATEAVYRVARRDGTQVTTEGHLLRRTLGSYIHLHFGSAPQAAAALVASCRAYRRERKRNA